MIDINIIDVSKKAGVSIATVSRVLNGTAKVSETTYKKVMNAVKALDYHPNIAGRNLRTNKTGNIMVVLNTLSNPFFPRIIKAIEEEASKDNYTVIITSVNGEKEKFRNQISLLKKRFADGAIFLSVDIPEECKSEVKDLSENLPIIQCCEQANIATIPEVRIDDFAAMYDMVSKLIKSGRKNIMYLSNDNILPSTTLRLEGYKQALKDGGIEFDENLILKGNYGYRNARLLTEEFIKNKKTFDAVVCNSDRMAAGAISVLKEEGFSIPDDIQVSGFDNIDLCHMVTPSITTVSQDRKAIGKKAYELLAKRIAGKEVNKNNIINYTIIERDSTKL